MFNVKPNFLDPLRLLRSDLNPLPLLPLSRLFWNNSSVVCVFSRFTDPPSDFVVFRFARFPSWPILCRGRHMSFLPLRLPVGSSHGSIYLLFSLVVQLGSVLQFFLSFPYLDIFTSPFFLVFLFPPPPFSSSESLKVDLFALASLPSCFPLLHDDWFFRSSVNL